MRLPGKLFRLARRGRRLAGLGWMWLLDQSLGSYSPGSDEFVPLWDQGDMEPFTLSTNEAAELRANAEHYLAHRFDILGSGWINWDVADDRRPRLNRANRRHAAHLALDLPAEYRGIDWHADRRAGYQFPAHRWARLIQPGKQPGVDIKIPWELARMQHLVQLALLAVDQKTESGLAAACEAEIHHQIRDFIVHNPPRFGVNWRVAMDVAIRASNWILALSVLHAHGRDIATSKELLSRSLRDHGRFIVNHLEWDPHWRGNHYLANICGLAFIAAALPADTETSGWLALAAGETVAEGCRQVHADGSGFEGSVSYHRLSLDMLAHTIALLLGLPEARWRPIRAGRRHTGVNIAGYRPAALAWGSEKDADTPVLVPEQLALRLWRAAEFTRAATRPDRRVLLIGDNDSGRFFKPCPPYEVLECDEASRRHPERQVDADCVRDRRELGEDHGHLLAAIEALFGVYALTDINAGLIKALAKGRQCKPPSAPRPAVLVRHPASQPVSGSDQLVLRFPRALRLDQVELYSFPGWGLYIMQGDGLLLSFRCGPLGLSGTGNHDHNDQLALTLHLDGRDWIADPGTYRYTADIAERDAYRSVKAHFAPRLRDSDAEPGSLTEGTWRLGDQAQAAIELVEPHCLQGRHQGYGVPVHRRVELHSDRLEICDWADGNIALLPLDEQFRQLDARGCSLPFCPDYGVRHA